jgi:excisionase family DNA binding protein
LSKRVPCPGRAMENDGYRPPRKHFKNVPWASVFSQWGPDVNRLLTIAEAAALLGVKAQTLYFWVSQKRVPHRKIGRLVRFTESDLEEFVGRQKQEAMDLEDDTLPTR